jgi:hypothetical protein
MSLVKKPKMIEKKVAANRRNRGLSCGPVTAEGKARIGDEDLVCHDVPEKKGVSGVVAEMLRERYV